MNDKEKNRGGRECERSTGHNKSAAETGRGRRGRRGARAAPFFISFQLFLYLREKAERNFRRLR